MAAAGAASVEALAVREETGNSMTKIQSVSQVLAPLIAILLTLTVGTISPSRSPAAAPLAPDSLMRQSDPEPPAHGSAAQGAAKSASTPGSKGRTNTGPVVIHAEVVDSRGKPLTGAAVGLRVIRTLESGATKSSLQLTTTDAQGQARFSVLAGPGERVSYGLLWAYMPGGALGFSGLLMHAMTPPQPVRLVLADPVKQTITVLGPDDRPIPGLRLAPPQFQFGGPLPLSPPAEWVERLTVTTNEKGAAVLPYLPREFRPLTVRVSGPSIAARTLPLPPATAPGEFVLKLGRPARLVGIVRATDGRPLAGAHVEVWARASGTLPEGAGMPRQSRRAAPTEMIRFDPDSVLSGPQGSFQTPLTLLGGSVYRVPIRHDGYAPFISDWVNLVDERAAIPKITMRPLRKLAGTVQDRQGDPVAGARVFLPAGGPATTTDAQGRFQLDAIRPRKTFLLAQKPGYRFHGMAVDPEAQPTGHVLKLVRNGETPEPAMKPLSDPLPAPELRALADRLLEPYLRAALEKGTDFEKMTALSALIEVDPDRVLKLLADQALANPGATARLRIQLAVKMAAQDATKAYAIATSIADPVGRGNALVSLAAVLPDPERPRKEALLEEAELALKAIAQPTRRIVLSGQIAGGWLDLGLLERARPLLDASRKAIDAQPPGSALLLPRSLAPLARLEPDATIERIQKTSDPETRFGSFLQILVPLAREHPAAAESVFNRLEPTHSAQIHTIVMTACHRLATVDPLRARRIAAMLDTPAERACAWAFVALGMRERDAAGSDQALDRSLAEIDRILESGPGSQPIMSATGVRRLYPANPAAVLLPLVEQVDAGRLPEFFWRAVALHDQVDDDLEERLRTSPIGFECMLLARYDRQTAAVVFAPMDAFIRSALALGDGSSELTESMMIGKACVDPTAAVALVEGLTTALPSAREDTADLARIDLAEVFAQPPEQRWNRLWRIISDEIPLDQ